MATVQCAATKGDLPLEITWMFRNEEINSGRQGMVVSEHGTRVKQLSIEDVSAIHAGEYTCVASNAAGSISRSAVLDVNGTYVLIRNLFFVFLDS